MRRTELATPCTANWDEMSGDEKIRHCRQCDLNVYNVSAMTDEEVLEQMVMLTAGKKVCMSLYRRSDGTFITKDCPVGLSRLQEKARHAASWIAGGLSLLVSLASGSWLPAAAQAACDWPRKPRWHSKIQVITASNKTTPTPAPTAGATPAAQNRPKAWRGGVARPAFTEQERAKLDNEIALMESEGKSNSVLFADKLMFRAHVWLTRKDDQNALSDYKRAFEIYTKLPETPSGYARSCAMQIATVYKLRNDLKAEEMWKEKAREVDTKNNESQSKENGS
jgi:hypothetical protein